MIRFSLITPEKTAYTGECDSVSLPTTTGQIQVLEKHEPLVSILAPGELKIVKGDEITYLAVSSGFIEVRPGGEVVVLANTAEVATDIDIERAEQARVRARELVAGKVTSAAEYAAIAGAMEKEWARLKVGRKHFSKRGPLGSMGVRPDTK